MPGALEGLQVAFLVANEGVEEVELTRPWAAVQEAGGTPHLVAPAAAEVETMHHLDHAGRFRVDRTTSEIAVEEYAGVVLPGGDEEVRICTSGPNVLVSSRKPDDLEAFCKAAVGEFAASGTVAGAG